MSDNSEPEEDRGLGTDYSAQEAEQMGAFVEDAILDRTFRSMTETKGMKTALFLVAGIYLS